MKKKLRKKSDLAVGAGITPQWLSNILSGRRRASWPLCETLSHLTDSDPAAWARQDTAAMALAVDRWMYGDEEAAA